MEEAPLFLQVISNFGFPIAITIFLLLRFEKRIEQLETSFKDLTNTLTKK
ncbi:MULTISPECIES: YvrJ family protein [Amphibacillus]|nr:YvrJ family protein [Amphibacillus jilinensis]MBM7541302.1 hypothetical protein [Amphibacillus cookii]